jgi:hypothetical protein
MYTLVFVAIYGVVSADFAVKVFRTSTLLEPQRDCLQAMMGDRPLDSPEGRLEDLSWPMTFTPGLALGHTKLTPYPGNQTLSVRRALLCHCWILGSQPTILVFKCDSQFEHRRAYDGY